MDANAHRLVWSSGLMLPRAAWERRRRLARELADYRTSAERDDLLAAVDRCPSAGREEIRRLLVSAARRDDVQHTPFHLRV